MNTTTATMKKVTKPRVRDIALGSELVAKQMQAKAGDLLPKHLANLESILFIHEGECIMHINEEEIILKEGKGFIVPAKVKHQIEALTEFKGLHFMPKDIKFQFFN